MDFFTLNWLLGIATLLMHVAILGLVALYFVRDVRLEGLVVRFALPLGFLLAGAGVVISLVYSEYFGLVPCGLCWLGRVFLYPQAIIFLIASWKRDVGVSLYAIALSIPGLLIALYQHYLQMGGAGVLPCPASGESDCAKRFLFEFDYITFPLIGATTFALIIVLMLFLRRAAREGKVA